MAVRSDLLFLQLNILPTQFRALFTVPAGETWLVKSFSVRALAGAGSSIVEYTLDHASGDVYLYREAIPAAGVIYREVWWAIDGGSTLFLGNATSPAPVECVGFGAKLKGQVP